MLGGSEGREGAILLIPGPGGGAGRRLRWSLLPPGLPGSSSSAHPGYTHTLTHGRGWTCTPSARCRRLHSQVVTLT